MTDEQWRKIFDYVTGRLQREESFSIGEQSFRRLFGLRRPFYEDMLARASDAPFEFTCGYRTSSGDPAEPIHFKRSDE
jgi:hypothetical protein